MCALDGYLYAFGGWVGEDIGGTIERYNPTKDQWEYLTKMQEPRFSMGICVYDSLIYLVGGCTHSRRHMQELVSYNLVNLLFYSDNFWLRFHIVVLRIVGFFFIPFILIWHILFNILLITNESILFLFIVVIIISHIAQKNIAHIALEGNK